VGITLAPGLLSGRQRKSLVASQAPKGSFEKSMQSLKLYANFLYIFMEPGSNFQQDLEEASTYKKVKNQLKELIFPQNLIGFLFICLQERAK
jgi:hypothetical protein